MTTGTFVFTVPETAKRLRVSDSTVRRLIQSGQIKPVRVGRSIRIDGRELERFLLRGGAR